MALNGKPDRRRHERLIKAIPIEFDLYRGESLHNSKKRYRTKTINMGMGGVSFSATIDDDVFLNECISKKKDLDLGLFLSEKNCILNTRGKIIWIYNLKGLPVKNKYAFGISFIDMNEDEKGILSSYLKEISTLKLEESIKNRKRIKQTLSIITRVDEDYFSEDTLIREELGIDSLMAMETLAAIETIYDIEIDENKAFEIVSVGDMMCLIEEHLERKKNK
ncbi:MAG: PilZ domain-containing protein [bacterium]